MIENSTEDRGELLTSEQVMDRLLALPWLRRRVATCVLPAVKCGHEWRFRTADLESWISEQSMARDARRGMASAAQATEHTAS
jgi:hypothetical protein